MTEEQERLMWLRGEIKMLREALARLRLRWTTAPPTEPGLYLLRRPDGESRWIRSHVELRPNDFPYIRCYAETEWAGPVPEPEEPPPCPGGRDREGARATGPTGRVGH